MACCYLSFGGVFTCYYSRLTWQDTIGGLDFSCNVVTFTLHDFVWLLESNWVDWRVCILLFLGVCFLGDFLTFDDNLVKER